MMGKRLGYSVVSLLCCLLGVFLWIEAATKSDIQGRLSNWVDRPTSIHGISLGLYTSELRSIAIPSVENKNFSNDMEIDSLLIKYNPTDILDGRITLLLIDGLTIHWQGLLGRNIQDLVSQVEESFPKSNRRSTKKQPDSLNIEETRLTNITIVVHIGPAVESFRIPVIVINDASGTHQSILLQVFEQIKGSVQMK